MKRNNRNAYSDLRKNRTHAMIKKITAKDVRYIKLGTGGCWERASIDRGEIHFGHADIPHALALEGDIEKIKEFQIARGKDPGAAREILDFYTSGKDCLWVTFCRGHLWWAFAKSGVQWLGRGGGHGERMRKTVGGWSNKDVDGAPLRIESLSTKLTKVASYRRTICKVEAKDYLLRRLNGTTEPIRTELTQARNTLVDATVKGLKHLDWADFEILVDIIFSRSGWHRASPLGGTQKLFDMVVEQPITAERAAVQIKSAADQKQLSGFIEQCDAAGTFDRLFFICHSPRGKLQVPQGRPDIHVWSTPELAQTILRHGLADWVVEKIS